MDKMGISVWILVICIITYANSNTDTPQTEENQENGTTIEMINHINPVEVMDNEPAYEIITGPETSDELAEDVGKAYQAAFNWLLSQHKDDWGWPLMSTATAILSLQSTNSSWYSKGTCDLSAQLSVKQLEIELLADLSRAKIVDKNSSRKTRTLPNISPGMLAYYVMALNATCHNVTDFYKNDLVEMLMNDMINFPQTNFNNYFQYGLALLALCKSGAHIKTRYLHEILNGQSEDGSYKFGTDVVSLALMAMACVRDKVPDGYIDDYNQKMQRSIDYILSNQNEDSTFGNQISTALAVQALTAAGVHPGNWTCHSAVRTVLATQETEGHFGSHGGTIQILPLLTNKTSGVVKDVNPFCDVVQEDGTVDESDFPQIEIILEIETSDKLRKLTVVVPENSTLHEAMVLAEKQNNTTFRFKAIWGQWGHYIAHINGVIENEGGNQHYWIILIGPERKPATTGADGIITEDGGRYIWQYKSFADEMD